MDAVLIFLRVVHIGSTVGGVAALLAFLGGMALIVPAANEQTAVSRELEQGDGVLTAHHRERLERAERRLKLASRIDLPLLLVAGLTMAVARYL